MLSAVRIVGRPQGLHDDFVVAGAGCIGLLAEAAARDKVVYIAAAVVVVELGVAGTDRVAYCPHKHTWALVENVEATVADAERPERSRSLQRYSHGCDRSSRGSVSTD